MRERRGRRESRSAPPDPRQPPAGEGESDADLEGFRLFPSRLTKGQRRVYGAVLAFYLAATAALVWPVYTAFAGVRPLLLGIPFSLFYVVVWVAASFLVLLGVYLWEGRGAEARGPAAEPRPPGEPGPTDPPGD